MLKIQNVGAFPGGDAFLLDDGSGACLLDTGFGFCGEALAVHVCRALAERPLDAIHRFKPYPRRSPRGASGIFLCASRPFMKDL